MTQIPDYAKLAATRAALAQKLARSVEDRLARLAHEQPGPQLTSALISVSDDCAVLSRVAAELALLHSLIDSAPAVDSVPAAPAGSVYADDSPPPARPRDDSPRGPVCALCGLPVRWNTEGVLMHSGDSPAAIIQAAGRPHLPVQAGQPLAGPPPEREGIWSPDGPRWGSSARAS